MKTFYSSTFIKKEELQEEGIAYPIKLEYYKIINEDEIMKGEKARFGIKVIKTEYINKTINMISNIFIFFFLRLFLVSKSSLSVLYLLPCE